MLFNSYLFIFLFLPLALLGWYGLNRIKCYRGAQIFLVGMSLWFYAYFNVRYLPIILFSCAVNYLLSALLAGAEKRAGRRSERDTIRRDRRIVRVMGCVCNLGILGYFKYYDFFIENLNAALSTDFTVRHILLPLGISFFTFQQLSFILDRCRGEAAHYGVVDYLTFVTFFPQLIAGPIVLHSELIPQFQDRQKRTFDAERFARGIAYFVFGLSKKVLLADLLAKPADFGFANISGLDSVSLALSALAYMLQLYFDFSGYCDMAVGIGKMFGVELPHNFNSPYQAVSVRDFWRRWHITLGRFFTTYVYIPLGGSRRGRLRTMRNTMIVFFLSGLWHGANWTFVVWGLLYGLAMVVNILHPVPERDGKRHVPAHIATFMFHYLSLIVFRSDTLADAFRYLKGLFSMTYFHSLRAVAGAMEVPELYIVEKFLSMRAPQHVAALHMAEFFFALAVGMLLIMGKNARERIEGRMLTGRFAMGLAVLFAWSVISLSGVSIFLYFNF
ncbi:MAG: MBOAT family protein [bacterium]|nr:MBOAT family protein [bacterium]